MLRRAVIQRLRDQVSGFGGRVYQAFLAPPDAGRPYATVKLPTQRGSPVIAFAGTQPVEVRIYDDRASFVSPDTLEQAVIAALTGAEVEDAGETYRLDWAPGGGDFVDEEHGLIGRLVVFEAAVLHERGN